MSRALVVLVLLLPSFHARSQTLIHDVGRLEFEVVGQGFLANAVDARANVVYPADQGGVGLLQQFSEVWVGQAEGPIASSLDLDQLTGQVVFGEWTEAANGAAEEISDREGIQVIRTSYEAQPSDVSLLPFHVLVEQTSYAWEDTSLPESNGVLLQLTLTNQGDLPVEDLFVALALNWDIDPQDAAANSPSEDLVQWDDDRRASIAFAGAASSGAGVHVAAALVQGDVWAHRILPVPQSPWVFQDSDRAAIMSTPVINAEAISARNYYVILSAGPIRLEGLTGVNRLFAFVGGEGRDEVEANLDAITRAAARPHSVQTEITDDGVHLTWSAPIRTDIVGYAIARSLEEDGTFQPIGPRFVDTVDYVDADVQPGLTYYYEVRPVDKDERPVDAPSAVASATTSPKPPTVTVLSALLGGTVALPAVELDLEAPSGVDTRTAQVLLYRNETGEPPFTLIQQSDFVTSFIDREVGLGKQYFYAVRILNDAGRAGDFSAPVSIETAALADTTPAPDLANVVVAPNPVHRSQGQSLRFMNLPVPTTIDIYTPAGQRIRRLDSRSRTFAWEPGSDLASGIYIYQITFVPEATSRDHLASPRGTQKARIAGKFVLMD